MLPRWLRRPRRRRSGEAPPRRRLARLLKPFEAFFRSEALGGMLLIVAAAVALAWANSPFASSYERLWSWQLTVGIAPFSLSKSLLHWINDFLMVIFFLLVGAEIKREIVAGELSSPRKAVIPAMAALGGMVVPAALYLALAHEGEAARGWGVPMATDIAFALGCLRLLGRRVPSGLGVLLAALAIIDDLGAIAVIAIFYTSEISLVALWVALGVTALLILLNLAGARRPIWYLLLGFPLWLAVLKSGVHATIAGVILAFCIPTKPRGDVPSPLSRIEHALEPWVAYGIVPLFALANAGLALYDVTTAQLFSRVAVGVFIALVVGKQAGVFAAIFLLAKSGLASLPAGATWRHLYGLSLLSGIGFTMSLFIADLAFGSGSPLQTEAKLGILIGSAVAALAGIAVLRLGPKPAK